MRPLAMEQRHHRDHDQVECQGKGSPGQQRHYPSAPWNRLPFRQPLEKIPHGKLVLRYQPRLDVRLQQQRPLILGGGVVEHLSKKRDELSTQSDGGDTGTDNHHGVDDDEILRCQGPSRPQDFQRRIEDDDGEKEKDGAR